MNDSRKGILLVNLGTPNSPSPKDVKKYLIEFLTDPRVLDFSWLWRNFLVRGVIVPRRYKQSALSYKKIWTSEGSPLLVYGQRVRDKLQETLGNSWIVELGMRYQQPSLQAALSSLLKASVDELIILPLFPQYASASTGSVIEKIMEILKKQLYIPKITWINSFGIHPAFIEAIGGICSAYSLKAYDHFLFSYHGLPQRHVRKLNKEGRCLNQDNCCQANENYFCYSAQCFSTTREIVKHLSIPEDKFSVCFQSRLGKEPWLQPYTSEKIKELAKKGNKKILVFCPSFVCDCLETIYEIGIEYADEFKSAGGETLDLVQGLNDHPLWIKALEQIIFESPSSFTHLNVKS
jgi:protoporphyrin/coproporphyrin ferrochelatase